MISVSDSFKEAMHAPVKVVKAALDFGDTTYASGDVLTKVEKQATGYYFGVATQALSVTLLGTNYNLVGQSFGFTLSVATDYSNGMWADSDQGRFTVYEQTIDLEKEMTAIKAYDAIGMAALKLYSAGDIVFPTTVADMAARIAADCAMVYEPTTLVNGSYTIEEDLYEKINNCTYRDILAEIAGATASLASVHGSQSELTFTAPQMTPSETWTYDNLKKIKFQPKYGEVNAVVLARTPQEDNIAVRDEASIEANGLTELKLANNEILDDARELLAQPILDAVNGFYFYPFEATTEGHGWHEIGDRIAVTDGTNTWDVIITDISLKVDGGLSETIKGVAPDESTTDYSLAGGITKTIYNTEIKVDKQNQEITSVVSRQNNLENETINNYSQIIQNINSITTTIQTTGGGNLIRNSVGYNKTNDGLVNWEEEGTISSESSPESLTYGAIAGNQIDLAASSSITQRITVDDTGSNQYSLSFKAKKGATGSATIHLVNSVDDYSIVVPVGSEVLWESYSLQALTPHDVYFDVVVETDADVTYFAITDLILNVGDSSTPWVSASDEILSKNVAIDSTGIIVKSSTTADYVQLNELGLKGYSDASGSLEEVFTVNRDVTETSKFKARKQISMPPIKIVPISSGSMAGWSFVQIGDNE